MQRYKHIQISQCVDTITGKTMTRTSEYEDNLSALEFRNKKMPRYSFVYMQKLYETLKFFKTPMHAHYAIGLITGRLVNGFNDIDISYNHIAASCCVSKKVACEISKAMKASELVYGKGRKWLINPTILLPSFIKDEEAAVLQHNYLRFKHSEGETFDFEKEKFRKCSLYKKIKFVKEDGYDGSKKDEAR